MVLTINEKSYWMNISLAELTKSNLGPSFYCFFLCVSVEKSVKIFVKQSIRQYS